MVDRWSTACKACKYSYELREGEFRLRADSFGVLQYSRDGSRHPDQAVTKGTLREASGQNGYRHKKEEKPDDRAAREGVEM